MADTVDEIVHRHIGYYGEPKTVWKIQWNGTFIRTRSGKSCWDSERAAKNAFYAHLNSSGIMYDISGITVGERRYRNEDTRSFTKQQIEAGHVQFVRVDL